MARSLVPTVVSTRDGVALPAEQAGNTVDGHYLQNSGKTKLLVRNSNGSATARVITFRFFKQVDGKSVTSRTESVPAGETQVFGPFPTEDYGRVLEIDVDNAELMLRAIE